MGKFRQWLTEFSASDMIFLLHVLIPTIYVFVEKSEMFIRISSLL